MCYLSNFHKQKGSKLSAPKLLNDINVRVFFGKNMEKKHLCRHDKNYYYFQKSNIPVINFIVDSRNMIKVSKIYVCKKLDKWRESFSPDTDNFLKFFIVFEWGRILKSSMDKQAVKHNAQLHRNQFSVNVSILDNVFCR